MAQSVYDLLGWVPLTKAVELVKGGLPPVGFDKLLNRKPRRVIGDTARYVTYKSTRQVSRQAPYGAPARQVGKVEIGLQDIRLLHSNEVMPYSQEMLRALTQWDTYEPQKMFFLDQLKFYSEQFAKRSQNLRVAMLLSNFANAGKVWFDGEGNLLPTASGATLEVDQMVPAANKNQLGGIIDVSWANPAANLEKQLQNLQTEGLKKTGYLLTTCFYSKNVATYVMSNTLAKEYLARNSDMNNRFLNNKGAIPNGLFGFDWVPVQNAFFEDSTGVPREIFQPDTAVFTPDLEDESWFATFEGSILVPKSFQYASNGVDGFSKNFAEAYGKYRYAYRGTNPRELFEEQGDTVLHKFLNPEVCYFADVTP
jgi:hypothetical protein